MRQQERQWAAGRAALLHPGVLRAQRFPLADSSSAFAWDAGSHKEQPSPTQKKGLLSPLISVAVIETLGPIEEKDPSRLEVPLFSFFRR